MRLQEAYSFSNYGNEFNLSVVGKIVDSRYPKDIRIKFEGTQHVKVYVGCILIEEGTSENEYRMKNFFETAFPYELYPLLKFELDGPYTIRYTETHVSPVTVQLILNKTVTYGAVVGTLYFRHGAVDYKPYRVVWMKDLNIDKTHVAIESFDWQMIAESYDFVYFDKDIMFNYGMRNEVHILESCDGDLPAPCILFPKYSVLAVIRGLRQMYPRARFRVNHTLPSTLLKKHKWFLDFILESSRERERTTLRRMISNERREMHTPLMD